LVISLGLAFYVYFQNKKDARSQTFALIAFLAALWIFTLLVSDYAKDINAILFWSQVAIIPPAFIPPLVLYFSFIFPKKNFEPPVSIKILLFIPPLFFLALAFTPYNVISVERRPWGTDVTPGPLYLALLVYFAIFVVFSLFNFIKNYRSLKEEVYKSQILYVVTGLIFVIGVNLLTSVIFIILGNSRFSAFGTASILVFLGLTIFAIVKKHLFDIRIISAEVLVILIGIGLLFDVMLSKTLAEGCLKSLLFVLTSYGGYRLIITIKQEIERRKEIEALTRELKKANIRLQELDRLKSEFLSVASHELNSPMAIILGYLHMILWEGFGQVDKNARQYLEKVYFKAELLAKLVSDLLNVSRIEDGRLRLEIQSVDSLAILEDLCEDYSRQAERKGLTFVFHRLSQPLPNVSVDPDKLKEVISNLLSNAVKFTKSGSIEVTVGQNNGEVVFNIKDTGIGIPKEAQSHIGEKFYRTDNSWVREAGGTGLGLYLVGQYLRLMNGRLWFESEEGKGSVFHFSLPVAKPGEKIHRVEETQITERPLYARSRISPEQVKERLNHQGGRGGQ